jgi:uncharacterized membrane protein YvbJ
MRQCPWCGHQNLNVYAYCQSCGRGFDGPEKPANAGKPRRRLWPFGGKTA